VIDTVCLDNICIFDITCSRCFKTMQIRG